MILKFPMYLKRTKNLSSSGESTKEKTVLCKLDYENVYKHAAHTGEHLLAATFINIIKGK